MGTEFGVKVAEADELQPDVNIADGPLDRLLGQVHVQALVVHSLLQFKNYYSNDYRYIAAVKLVTGSKDREDQGWAGQRQARTGTPNRPNRDQPP